VLPAHPPTSPFRVFNRYATSFAFTFPLPLRGCCTTFCLLLGSVNFIWPGWILKFSNRWRQLSVEVENRLLQLHFPCHGLLNCPWKWGTWSWGRRPHLWLTNCNQHFWHQGKSTTNNLKRRSKVWRANQISMETATIFKEIRWDLDI